jgi:hypothetical protein
MSHLSKIPFELQSVKRRLPIKRAPVDVATSAASPDNDKMLDPVPAGIDTHGSRALKLSIRKPESQPETDLVNNFRPQVVVTSALAPEISMGPSTASEKLSPL